MNKSLKPNLSYIISAGLVLMLTFVFFFFFNRYHLWYLEQNQIFLNDSRYLKAFLSKPGGFILLAGEFFTQFFHFAWAGALIITILIGTNFTLVWKILSHYRKDGYLFPSISAIVLIALHCNHNYTTAYSVGWMMILAGFNLYILFSRKISLAGVPIFIILYLLTGFFSFIFLLLVWIHELIFIKEKYGFIYSLVLLVIALVVPLISRHTIFLLNQAQSFLSPVSQLYISNSRKWLYLLTLTLPILQLISMLPEIPLKNFNIKQYLVHFINIALIFLFFLFAIRLAYDKRNELFLKIDNSIRKADWKKALVLSEKYQGNNRLVVYLSNLALYKTGKMPDALFNHKQFGTKGLWLDWSRNETAPLYGSEYYYQLGFINEAFRWTFEGMEINGPNPHALKRLTILSLINRDYSLANKYLSLLHKTLFYKSWAARYIRLLNDTTLIESNNEISEKRKLLASLDFISGRNSPMAELNELLVNHPGNRMAFEYLMSSFLFEKRLDLFAANIYRLKEMGYKTIPRHYEEAIVLYEGINREKITPEGYTVSDDCKSRFHKYASLFARNRYSMSDASKVLGHEFSNTFWYYMQFADNTNVKAKSEE